MTTPPKVKTSIQIEEESLRRLKQLSRSEKRTVSAVVEVLIEERFEALAAAKPRHEKEAA